jgi:hypothetical protein
MEEKERQTCLLTYDQYINFRQLPIVQECIIIKRNQENIESYKEEMQKAINFATENTTTHIRKLSEIIR